MELSDFIQNHPKLKNMVEHILEVWPDHLKFLQKSFLSRTPEQMQDSEFVSDLILKIAGTDLLQYCQDYKWTCEQLLEEEFFFRRQGTYRFSKLSELSDFVYGNPQYMVRYVHGLLLSQLFWLNHISTFGYLRNQFLPTNPNGYRHLEIGPGHGLLLHLASSDPRCKTAVGWDISPSSLAETEKCLKKLGNASVTLTLGDVTELRDHEEPFDSIVMSEILEHVEKPVELLKGVAQRLSKNGRIFINVPVNSPARDHIYLLKSPEEAIEMVQAAGLKVCQSAFYPMTGYTEERARKAKTTISCVLVAGQA